jgi:hypothetical protein
VSLENCTFVAATEGGASTEFVFLTPTVVETWTSADGSGIERSTPQGPGHFQTSQEQLRFAASGLTNPCIQVPQTKTVPQSTPQIPGIAMLPTNSQMLGALIAAGRVNDVGQVTATSGKCPSQNGDANQIFASGQVCNVAAQFDIVNNLLSFPEGPAKLGPVLYDVLAQLPGVEIIGTQTDAVGRSGTAIEDPSSGDVVVLDPTTGALLETETLLATPGTPTAGASPGAPKGTVLSSTTYATDGVVQSEGAVPSN